MYCLDELIKSWSLHLNQIAIWTMDQYLLILSRKSMPLYLRYFTKPGTVIFHFFFYQLGTVVAGLLTSLLSCFPHKKGS